jgi:hypothetical protein
MRDVEGGLYYAQIRGLLTDQYCEKSCVVTWLLPTQASPNTEEGFDPATYIIGNVAFLWRIASSGMLSRVALVKTDISEELSASFIRVTRIGELGTLAVTSNPLTLRRLLVLPNIPSSPILVTLMMKALSSSKMSVLTRATRCNIPEDAILQFKDSFPCFYYPDRCKKQIFWSFSWW